MIINRTADDYRPPTQSIPSLLKLLLSYHAAFIETTFLGLVSGLRRPDLPPQLGYRWRHDGVIVGADHCDGVAHFLGQIV
jgi:hypothetical protein